MESHCGHLRPGEGLGEEQEVPAGSGRFGQGGGRSGQVRAGSPPEPWQRLQQPCDC